MPNPILRTSQASTPTQLMQQVEPSVVPKAKANHFQVDHNAGVVKLPPTSYQEKSNNLGPQSLKVKKDNEMKHEENVNYLKDYDVNDAVELSIGASEAMVIHEVINILSEAKVFPASAALEVALRVKQARLDGFQEAFHISSEENSETDFLSDLDESTVQDAYEDVGLSTTGTSDLTGSLISKVKDSFVSETCRSDDRLKCNELEAEEVDSGDISKKQQLQDFGNTSTQKDLLQPLDDGKQKKQSNDPALGLGTASLACNYDDMLHLSIQANSNISSATEKELKASASMKHTTAKSIPKPFVGETSFLSESPDENSFIQRHGNRFNVVSQSSVAFEGSCNKVNQNMLISEDAVDSRCAPFLDPLCSVVPCSISSEPACFSLARGGDDKADTGECFSPIAEGSMHSLKRTTAPNIGFFPAEGAGPVANGVVSQLSVRRRSTSLRTYSMLLSSHDRFLERDDILCDPSNRLKCNPSLPASVVQISETDLADEVRDHDENAKDGMDLPVHMIEEESSLIRLEHGEQSIFPGSESILHDLGEEESQKMTTAPEIDVEMQQSKNLRKAGSECKDLHNSRVPGIKRVHFSDVRTDLQKRKLHTTQTTNKNTSTARTGKGLKRSNQCIECGAQEVKRRLTKCLEKDRKRLIFQNLEFLLTGFSRRKEKEIEGLIRKYGGIVLPDIPSPTRRGKRCSRFKAQHLPVILCYKKLQTPKFLYGCAVNACILRVHWLTDSISAGSVLPPDKYMILPNRVGERCSRVGKPLLCHRRIFDSVGIMLHGRHNFCTNIAKVVKHGGGLVFKTLQWLVQSLDGEKISMGVIITEDEGRVSRHLKHCASEQKIHLMPATWIITSLYAGELPFIEKSHSSPSLPVNHLDVPVPMELSEEI
ncbi:hypothetical protein RJ640_015225 [Escallonia rubra]|uniref:BRCT domain-containing protein n=1 Tax=Escallonia rubra TaxID=112253 RepID=A0AA88QRP7_9ASTE|nr:hypothetical protein RJ640_015225 [Escallonia rubra]